jgi:hypothetical protein
MNRSGKPAQNVLGTTELGHVGAACSWTRDTAGKRGDGPVYNYMKILWKGNIFSVAPVLGARLWVIYMPVDVIYTVSRELVSFFEIDFRSMNHSI